MKTYIRWFNMTLIGSFLFAGLSITGWGWGDLNGFFSHPARLFYVAIMIILQGVVAAWIPDLMMGKGKGKTTVDRQKWVIVLLQISSLGIVMIPPYCDRREIWVMPWDGTLRFTGLFLMTGGFLLMNWAVASLGRQFSMQVTLQENHQLVTEGAFKRIRHPRYCGILFFFFGISLVFKSWIGLILTGVVIWVLLWRMKDEETLMAEEFGDEWKAYAAHTWRLVPRVW
jgi:protein-S-isoprenylcysteine O-methyltransferase Ste14